MMLRGNLATRPFYNERGVSLLLGLIAVAAIALTVFNASSLVRLSSSRSTLQSKMDRDQAAADKIKAGAVAVQNSVDRSALQGLADSTRLANTLIDQRTFSWITFFGLIEDTMPMDVRLTAVSPEISKGEIIVTMLLVGKRPQDVEAFMKALEQTGSFYDVLPTSQDFTEEGMQRVAMRAGYVPPAPPAPPAKRAGGGRP